MRDVIVGPGGSSPSIFQSKHLLLVGRFYSHPFERYAQVTIGIIFPQGKGVKIEKSLSCYHLDKVQLSFKKFQGFFGKSAKQSPRSSPTKIAPWWCTGTTATARRAQSGFTLRHMKPLSPRFWWKKSGDHQLRLVVSPHYVQGFLRKFQVVVWDFFDQQYQAWSKGEVELVHPGRLTAGT